MAVHPTDSIESGLANQKSRNHYMKAYRIVDRSNSQLLRDFLVSNEQVLLPMVKLIEGSRMAIDELVDMLGPASIKTVLQVSARVGG